MPYLGIYIDDNNEERQMYAELLSDDRNEGVSFSGNIKNEALQKLKDDILGVNPDILGLDYRLDEDKSSGNENDYKAGAVAQLLREVAIDTPENDFPIILVSSEDKIRRLYHPDKTAHDLFDLQYAKETVSNNRSDIHIQIRSLVKGYKSIIHFIKDNENRHLGLLGLTNDEWDIIEPWDLKIELEDAAVPHVIARTLIQNVICRTGLLLSPSDIYARLGLAQNNQNLGDVFDFLNAQGLSYDGVFSDGWSRVWKHRFEDWSNRVFNQNVLGIYATKRVEKLNELMGSEYTPAQSKWSGKSDERFAFACASCEHPTEIRYSVAAHDPYVPRYAEKKRICFDCIEIEAYRNLYLRVDSADERIQSNIVDGKTLRPS